MLKPRQREDQTEKKQSEGCEPARKGGMVPQQGAKVDAEGPWRDKDTQGCGVAAAIAQDLDAAPHMESGVAQPHRYG